MSRIWIAGATGLVGQALVMSLFRKGHEITVISRDAKRAVMDLGLPLQAWSWKEVKSLTPQVVADFQTADVLINLSGDNIGDGAWNEQKKKRILDSRVDTTHLLGELNKKAPCKTWIQASAIGIFGDRGDERLTETSAPGTDFLAQVCKQWEAAFWASVQETKTRPVLVRIGTVLAPNGGALTKMRPPFESGVGGVLGSGEQWLSWIHLNDLVGLIEHALATPTLSNVIHAVSPQALKFKDFAAVLGKALGVPALLPVPAVVLRLLLGEMSVLVLGSTRVSGADMGYEFKFASLDSALSHLLGEGAHHFYSHQWFEGADLAKLFDFFSKAQNLGKVTPDFLSFKILSESQEPMAQGSLIEYQIKVHGVPLKWKTRIEEWSPPNQFVDVQLSGPYQSWHHTHRFTAIKNKDSSGVLMEDLVKYQLPKLARKLGPIAFGAGAFIRRDVNQIFDYRSQVMNKIQHQFTLK